MELSKQVVSLELAKKLKELGFEQDSYFYWVSEDDEKMFISTSTMLVYGSAPDLSVSDYPFIYSAYTVAELGLLIPIDYWNCQSRTMNSGFSFHYGDEEAVYADTEADARAELLIDLKENKLI